MAGDMLLLKLPDDGGEEVKGSARVELLPAVVLKWDVPVICIAAGEGGRGHVEDEGPGRMRRHSKWGRMDLEDVRNRRARKSENECGGGSEAANAEFRM